MKVSLARAGVVIVGAGHAGGTVAALLRKHAFSEPIVLLGEEPEVPYHRPPLSKAWLKSDLDRASLALRQHAFYAENDIELQLGQKVTGIHRDTCEVQLADGRRIPYQKLVLATGARARPLPALAEGFANVLSLRTTADADALKKLLVAGNRLVIIGGGYIGLEVAASAMSVGAHATVVEGEARLLARVASGVLSEFFRDLHSRHGVRLELGRRVSGLETQGDKVVAVALSNGTTLPCDAVLVGIGSVPNLELAQSAGLACADGIVVDLDARTSDPAIFAVGDVTWRPLPHFECAFRLQSVANAVEQARQAACAIVGRPAPAAEVPWNWSDQYDIKLQLAGLLGPEDQLTVRGVPSEARFAAFHSRNGVLRAVEAINSPGEFMAGRQLIGMQCQIDTQQLADPAVPMKDLLQAAQRTRSA
jgi:3-phenylpropionate/trans-cinnamate dioxygenase ferredoxin reductase subunit